jgi:hypothetical protein
MRTLFGDLRLALRTFVKHPGVSLVAVQSLAFDFERRRRTRATIA